MFNQHQIEIQRQSLNNVLKKVVLKFENISPK